MRTPFLSASLFSSLLILSACTTDPTPNATEQDNTGTIMAMSGTTLESPNEKTPLTIDPPERLEERNRSDRAGSLEVRNPDSDETIETSVTESGTIIAGNPADPNRLVIISDYDCVYCRQFLTNDLPWTLENFVAKGTLSIERVFLPMSKIGENAARLALCAAEQKRFPQADLWLSTRTIASIDTKMFAKAIGLNLQKLLQCTARKNLLDGNLEKAGQYHVERVPFFILGNDSWLGLLTKEELQRRIAK